MQKFMLIEIESDHIEIGDLGVLEKWQQNSSGLLWVDIEGKAEKADHDLLLNTLNLPEAEVTDALRDRHPPSISMEKDLLFLLLKPLDSESTSLDFDTQQLAIFGGKNFIVTRHSKYSEYLQTLWDRVAQKKTAIDSTSQVFALLARRMVSRYGRILLDLEERLDELENEIMQNPKESLLQELVGYNTSLRKMRRILKYHVGVIDQLTSHVRRQQTNEWLDEFEDISDQAERFNSLAELYQSVINDLIEGYISLNAHYLNQVMKVLTVVTVVFLPLSLLVGIYGMNFENMPELKSQNGYFILIGVMVAIATTLAYVFRRMKWL